MASPSIVLKQVKTNGSSASELYEVPEDRRASLRVHVSTVTAADVDVFIRKNGEAAADKQYIARGYAVGANEFEAFPAGGTLLVDDGDIVMVESDQTDTAWTGNAYEDDIPT